MVQPLGEVTLVKGEREKKKGKKSIFALIWQPNSLAQLEMSSFLASLQSQWTIARKSASFQRAQHTEHRLTTSASHCAGRQRRCCRRLTAYPRELEVASGLPCPAVFVFFCGVVCLNVIEVRIQLDEHSGAGPRNGPRKSCCALWVA